MTLEDLRIQQKLSPDVFDSWAFRHRDLNFMTDGQTPVYGYSATWWTLTILFISRHRPRLVMLTFDDLGRRCLDFRDRSGREEASDGSAHINVEHAHRLPIPVGVTPDAVLEWLREPARRGYGDVWIAEDAEELLKEGRAKAFVKKLLCVVSLEIYSYPSEYRLTWGRNGNDVKYNDGDPWPYDPDEALDSSNRWRPHSYHLGYFLCKNGHVMCYASRSRLREMGPDDEFEAADFSQGPGSMEHPSMALKCYEAVMDAPVGEPVLRAQSFEGSSRCRVAVISRHSGELTEEQLDMLRSQVFCKQLQKGDGAKRSAYDSNYGRYLWNPTPYEGGA